MNEDLKLGNVSANTVARVIMLFISIFNEMALSFGWYTINVTDDDVTKVVSFAFMVIMALWCAWKNNSFTKPAIQSDQIMKAEKEGKEVSVVISDPEESTQEEAK